MFKEKQPYDRIKYILLYAGHIPKYQYMSIRVWIIPVVTSRETESQGHDLVFQRQPRNSITRLAAWSC